MMTVLLVVYVVGLAVTAVTVLTGRAFSQATMTAAAIALWPVYWGFFLASFLQNRTPAAAPRRRK